MVSNIFYFHPYLGKWSNLTNIFQMGWNQKLVMIWGFSPSFWKHPYWGPRVDWVDLLHLPGCLCHCQSPGMWLIEPPKPRRFEPWEPTTFIFRELYITYNSYLGGLKPAFFMVLGSKGSYNSIFAKLHCTLCQTRILMRSCWIRVLILSHPCHMLVARGLVNVDSGWPTCTKNLFLGFSPRGGKDSEECWTSLFENMFKNSLEGWIISI